MSAPDASAFLRKRKDKPRAGPYLYGPKPSSLPFGSSSGAWPSTTSQPSSSSLSSQHADAHAHPDAAPSASAGISDPSRIVEIKLFSGPPATSTSRRHNIMRFQHAQAFDPALIRPPVLLNRKQPGPKEAPKFLYDDDGNILGKYVYDAEGRPVVDASGEQVVERRDVPDKALVGGGGARGKGRQVKEVFQGDREKLRLRREEAVPWVLESGASAAGEQDGEGRGDKAPQHWVGRYKEESSAMQSVLFVNKGDGEQGFTVIPVGRTYGFDPERPFKVLDPDAAHKLFEQQAKFKSHDRWGQREGGATAAHVPVARRPAGASGGARANGIKREESDVKPRAGILDRVMQLQAQSGPGRRVKQERYDDDDRREGRGLVRGLEGGADEELDFDQAEEFQDDDDLNTFYRNQDEEEDAKVNEDELKKQYRLANANVGDRPQISDEEDDDDRERNGELTKDGKRLRKMMRKRRGSEDLFGSSDEDSDSDDETARKEAERKEAERKEAEKRAAAAATAAVGRPPGSAERPSRPSSQQGHNRSDRGATTPGGSSRQYSPTPTKGNKSSTAPPVSVSGASLVAQRATNSRGGSPMRSRHASPRAASPDSGAGGGRSPSRGASPVMGRAASPPGPSSSSGAGVQRSGSPSVQRPGGSASGSPAPSPNPKRKPSPSGSVGGPSSGPAGGNSGGGGGDPPRKKKKQSSKTPTPAPEDIEPFEGMITRDELLAWFTAQGKVQFPMNEVINAFKHRILAAGAVGKAQQQQQLVLMYVAQLTVNVGNKVLQLRSDFRPSAGQ